MLLLILIVVTISGVGSYVHASGNSNSGVYGNPASNTPASYTLLEPLPCIPNASGTNCTAGTMIQKVDFQTYIQYLFDLTIAVAAFAAVFMIIWGGFQYMSTDAWEAKSEGISKLKNAVLGLLLILCSYLILKTVDPRLVNIPTTLVTPLSITYEKSTKNNVQDLVSKISNQFNVNVDNLNKAVQETQLTVSELQQEITANQGILQALGCSGPIPDPSCATLKLSNANLNNQLDTAKGTLVANTGMLAINQVAADYASTSNEVMTLKNINDIAATTDTQLNATGQYQNIQMVNDAVTTQKAQLAILAAQKILNSVKLQDDGKFFDLPVFDATLSYTGLNNDYHTITPEGLKSMLSDYISAAQSNWAEIKTESSQKTALHDSILQLSKSLNNTLPSNGKLNIKPK